METRHVLSVSASFVGGMLDIQLSLGGPDSVGLFASGSDFFVDQNNNQSQDVGEVSGLIANLGRLQAASPDLVGTFLWHGDFSRAPLHQPDQAGSVVSIIGFNQIQLMANFRADGNVRLASFDNVSLGGQAAIAGTAQLSSQIGSIISEPASVWSFQSSADFTARNSIELAQSTTERWLFQDVHFESTHGTVLLGFDHNVELNQLSISGHSAIVQIHGDAQLQTVAVAGDFTLETDGRVHDGLAAALRIEGQLNLSAGEIVLGDDVQDELTVGAAGRLNATANAQLSSLISVGSLGRADFVSLHATGSQITFRDANSLSVSNLIATSDVDLWANGALSDLVGANIDIDGQARLIANAIILSDQAADRMHIDGPVFLQALMADIAIGAAGDVRLGEVTALGANIALQADEPLLLREVSATDELTLTSGGAIRDVVGASWSAVTGATLQGTMIEIGDDNQDVVDLRGMVELQALAGDVTVGLGGSTMLGTVLASGRNVRIVEQDNVIVSELDVVNDFQVSTAGSITDTTGALLRIGGNGSFIGSSIALSTNPSDQLIVAGQLQLDARDGDIVIGPAGAASASSVSASGRNVSLNFVSDLGLQELDVTGTLSVTSQSVLATEAGANIHVRGNGEFMGSSLRLAEDVTSSLIVDEVATFRATAGDVTVGADGLVRLGSVVASANNLYLQEDSDLVLSQLAVTGNAQLISSGTISDSVASRLEIDGQANFIATSLQLADDAQDEFSVNGAVQLSATNGDIVIGPAGVVHLGAITARGNRLEITEFSAMSLELIESSQEARLTSLNAITDTTGARFLVADKLFLDGTSIHLADDALDVIQVDGNIGLRARTGDVRLDSAGLVRLGNVDAQGRHVSITEDNDLVLASIQADENLELASLGSITDRAGAMLFASGNATLTAAFIDLADQVNDRLNFMGPVTLLASVGDIGIGPDGHVQLGTVSATARHVSISEDASLTLNQLQVTDNLELESSGAITDQAGAQIAVGAAASFRGTSITLADQSADQMLIGGDVNLRATNGDVHLGGAGLVQLGTITALGQNLEISEDTDTVLLALTATSGLYLSSGGTVTDLAGAQISIAGTADVRGTEITLADNAGDLLQVNGSIFLTAQNDVMIGEPGQVKLGNVSSIARHLTLTEDADTSLDDTRLRGNWLLVSSGSISDVAGAWVSVQGVASLTGRDIQLADQVDNQLLITGAVTLHATRDIVIAGDGLVVLGTIDRADANRITIFEDAEMVLNNVLADQDLRLDSTRSIVNLQAALAAGTGVQASHAWVTAGSYVHLGSVNFQTLQGGYQENGLLGFRELFALNNRADAAGTEVLGWLNEPDVNGVPAPTRWIDGSEYADVQRQFSYQERMNGQFAFYLTNLQDLRVQAMLGMGDSLHSYIETLGEHNLSVVGTVQLVNTSAAHGAIVLIAGADLSIGAQGALETLDASGLSRDTQRVLQSFFEADTFDGGEGPPGFESTRSVILERALYADTRGDAVLAGAQNVFQQISSQFGATGEAGFLAIVRYADGRTQLFDTYQEVVGSFDGNTGVKGSAGTFQGAIPAHPASQGAAAVFARSIAFEDVFLNAEQDLPTAVLYRRSTDFYLFETGGSQDVTIRAVELNSDFDRVLEVLTNAIPPSFSLPTIIETTPVILPAPLNVITESTNSVNEIDQELESKVEFEDTRQVVIYRIGFEDQNENGQPEDRELPSRDQIVGQYRSRRVPAAEPPITTSPSSQELTNGTLEPGQIDPQSRDVQKDLNPTPETLDEWIDAYRRDPSIVSGAYSIVEEASRTGIEVLRVFSVRDFDEAPSTVPGASGPDHASPIERSVPQDDNPGAANCDSSASEDDVTRAMPGLTPAENWKAMQDQSSVPMAAFVMAGGLVWLNKSRAKRVCDAQLAALAESAICFDRQARQQRRRVDVAEEIRRDN